MNSGNYNSKTSTSKPMLLNIGCGRRYHQDWINLDLESNDASVICHDVTKGIPFGDNQFSAVYHSHILEHLSPEQGRELIAECYRVLKPGGVLRIVVPDLEGIAKLYLETHNQAWQGDEQSKVNYNWMKLELLDQLVRRSSGGNMGRYMASKEIENSDFVRSRVGDELDLCQSAPEVRQRRADSLLQRLSKATLSFRVNLIRRCIGLLLGKKAKHAFNEGLFRSQGEIHRWMYDRYSLRELAASFGFAKFRVCQADESEIEGYAGYSLDTAGETVRKPDSIFVECTKQPNSLAEKLTEKDTFQNEASYRAAG